MLENASGENIVIRLERHMKSQIITHNYRNQVEYGTGGYTVKC